MDQLFQNMRYENADEGHGWMAESQNPDVHLETVEDAATAGMGIAKTWHEPILGTCEREQSQRNRGNRLQRNYEPYCHERCSQEKRSALLSRPLPVNT